MYTFHLEAAADDPSALSPDAADPGVLDLCRGVRAAHMHVGLALRPSTPAELVVPYVEAGVVDMVGGVRERGHGRGAVVLRLWLGL